MAKQFFYFAAGAFLLVAAYSLGAERARATPNSTRSVIGVSDGRYAWNAQGEAYAAYLVGAEGAWDRYQLHDLPFAPADLEFLDATAQGVIAVAQDGQAWWFALGRWNAMKPVPGVPVPVEAQSFGSIKTKHR